MMSKAALPPISAAEAKGADTAICPLHRGMIARMPTSMDREGRVYFCPIGGQYWRYRRERGAFTAPLSYPRLGII